ncbi:MAG: TerC family protein [Phycisphaerales bacterium]|nr:TerC family protein [Phycisphaerales bacterium]
MVWLYAGFVLFVMLMLALDLGVVNRGHKEVRARDALAFTLICVVLALAFNVLVYFIYENHWFGIGIEQVTQSDGTVIEKHLSGWEASIQFLTGWMLEYSLSLDNIFVIAVIFGYFRVPPRYQHRVLFWGILGALLMRGVMIGLGAVLIDTFSWIIYVFGGLLIITAVKMLISQDESPHPENNPLVRIAQRLYPVTPDFEEERFFSKLNGRTAITPLFLCLLVIESTDVLFAIDSIPAIFVITKEPFIVFTSNVFAILGLRSMYFALSAAIEKFKYLKSSLSFVLAYIGVKMLISDFYHIPIPVTLGVIAGTMVVGVIASIVAARNEARKAEAPAAPPTQFESAD